MGHPPPSCGVCCLQEELREGSGAFLVHAYLPVEASFGLADEMRRRSSGAASASLLLSHWERLQVRANAEQGSACWTGSGSGFSELCAGWPMWARLRCKVRLRCEVFWRALIVCCHLPCPVVLQVDPFFVPTTEEELEEFGFEAGGPANLARRLIDAVRRRKGLPVEEKVVAKATKQRTLKRNV